MISREGKTDKNFQVMSGPTSERVFKSMGTTFINQRNSYQAIKDKMVTGKRTKTLLNADKTTKENLTMDLINDLFGASKKRQ